MAKASGVTLYDQEVQPISTFTIPGFPVGSEMEITIDGQRTVFGPVTSAGGGFSYGFGTGCDFQATG